MNSIRAFLTTYQYYEMIYGYFRSLDIVFENEILRLVYEMSAMYLCHFYSELISPKLPKPTYLFGLTDESFIGGMKGDFY